MTQVVTQGTLERALTILSWNKLDPVFTGALTDCRGFDAPLVPHKS